MVCVLAEGECSRGWVGPPGAVRPQRSYISPASSAACVLTVLSESFLSALQVRPTVDSNV